MKAGWEKKPFEDCIEAVKYTRKIQRKDFLDHGQFPIVSQEAEFINGYWDDEADTFKISTPVIIFGDHTQVLKYVDFDFVLGADGVKILPPRNFLRPKFFFYQLQAANFTTLGYARHYRLLKELEIKHPLLPEQERIVGVLDEAFDGIAKAKALAEANLQNARALFQSHLQSVFSQRGEGWVERRLDEICVIGDGNHSSNYPRKEELVEAGIPFIRATNMVGGKISGEDMRFLSPEKHTQLRKGHLKTGDILVTNRGEIGKIAIVDEDYDNSNLNSQIAWLRCGENASNMFLIYALQAPIIQAHFQSSKSGAALQQFTIRQLKELKVPQPPLETQITIAQSFDDIASETQRLESFYQTKLDALNELKKSLLHQAFSGNL